MVKPEREKEIREVFGKVLAARALGSDAKDLADRYSFETLVRIHRAGEGAPYTGLLPSGAPIESMISLADKAIAAGDVSVLAKAMAEKVDEGIRERFARVAATKRAVDQSVEAGRRFVDAYVEFTHYVEGLHASAADAGLHAEGAHSVPVDHQH